ncbi:type IV pili twitching motility protein PilT [Candidatus Nomurabacteria bacterium RIFCSPHIGHO2_01_FULL_37_25]|uniref:Type IV pili twitching motility protein PilT n=1 Tax=Candidatus Nomurabacteria bacterium RIFCSPLOWO2_01_FULL_36_16 TaxID=1801767 RepID=A0A1F6WYS2_9BACT|nr:MAG: type IV pili twitching motility protein PilT [Candidatus Nomurabacteria bacterium RIFCSPHIGHO2_01_FULL_37_25]OGI75425.1 MAG: type IV pili twitching motility protein PilT [Candidatus Nomurabacteria bacterium RIFCSPHIGHO2_02_FULL_36_29]OGI86924.1 MAG: type IV pili twitching motility protein PilT [Candidatus Nomurabacteria bacterium RIFCSPLOWO2_01_FULL_36_16]OGI95692.1 MAG: type IV pili twitching motility protein PilT [Candidatus Nomurabacteria bacterium RIFCSPLOWO2_02_FULL_36_8]
MDYKTKLEELILTVIHEGGSDLHLGTGRVPIIRVSGELIFLAKHSVFTEGDIMGFLGEVLEKEKIDSFMENHEADFSYDFRGEARLRGNAFFQKGLICLVFRLVPKVKTFAELHLPPVLADLARKKQGFFLVVGPVGQGKSTTLSAMIDLINKEQARNIVTIEDPIEHVYIPNKSIINQREVGIDTHDFNVALKSVFREDVNVIMIGEMRTPGTIATAVTAAETGHLVFSTLHTNNASQTIDRIIDSFPGDQQDQIRAQLASSLLGIFSQRLIPRITGGLIPAYELLLNNNAVANLIREKRTHEVDIVIETGMESGMVDLNHSLIELVRAGEISIENAYQYSLNPKGLERMI